MSARYPYRLEMSGQEPLFSFDYAGEGPEIGRDYGYRISGFVTHDPPRFGDRLKHRLASARVAISALSPRLARRRADQRAPRAAPALPERHGGPTAVMRVVAVMLRLVSSVFGFVWRRCLLPLVQHAAYTAVRHPAFLLSLGMAGVLVSAVWREHERSLAPEAFANETVAELRLATGSIGTAARTSSSEGWRNWKGRILPVFALEAPDLSRLTQHYGVRVKGEAREDSLAWSEPAGSPAQGTGKPQSFSPAVLFVIERNLPAEDIGPLYRDTLRRATQHGLTVLSAGPPGALATKFGPVDVADVVLARDVARPSEQARPCLAFRQQGDPSVFRLSGWACAERGRVIERPALAILIDRLSLIGAGRDERLHQVFVDAALSPALNPDRAGATRLPSWLGGTAPPQLKRDLKSRSHHAG